MPFWFVEDPRDEELAQLQAADPTNPFANPAYARARRLVGARVVLFAEGESGIISTGAIGYLHGGLLFPTLEITSSPAPGDVVAFWTGVRSFCKRMRVVSVDIDSFGTRAVSLPPWNEPRELRSRIEWRLSLDRDSANSLSANHRRSINKARKHGVTVVSRVDAAAGETHASLMAASMQRRAERGESVPTVSSFDSRLTSAFLASGAGRLYQANYGAEIVSSILVLLGTTGAYYHSAGTTPGGMEVGASTYLVSEVAARLRAEGLTLFNLSGAGPETPGLQRFKSSFGAEPLLLPAATYQMAAPVIRKMRTGFYFLRHPRRLLRAFLTIDRMVHS